MTNASTRAPSAHPLNPLPTLSETFDPAAWLERYTALGGIYVANGKLNLCVLVSQQSAEELSQVREMVAALTEADKAAILAHLKAAQAGPPMTWEDVVARFHADKAAADAHPYGRAHPDDPAYGQMHREHGALLRTQCASLGKLLATRAPTHSALLRKLGIIGREYEIEDGIIGHLQADVAGLTKPAANEGDEDIFNAWDRRRAARVRYNALPHSIIDSDDLSPEEQAEWNIIDAAEEVIRSTVAATPEGVAIQLWTAFQNFTTSGWEEDACLARDLPALEAREDEMDWRVRLILAALRSLKSMEA